MDGVVYVAVGASFIEEACQSAASLKRHNPDLGVTLFADRAVAGGCFDNVVVMEGAGHPKARRIECLVKSPYARTLFLDSDTFVCGPIGEMFAVLEQFEFGIMPAPRRLRPRDLEALGQYMRRVPLSFAQLNCGVMLYRRCANVERLFAEWLALYRRDLETIRASGYQDPKYEGIGDQAAFREAFYGNPVRWMALPTEYNCIAVLPGYLHDEVKILHGRYGDPAEVAGAALNERLGARVHFLGSGGMHVGYEGGDQRTFGSKTLAGRLVRGFSRLFSSRNGR